MGTIDKEGNIDVQGLVDMNFRALMLLGFAYAMVCGLKETNCSPDPKFDEKITWLGKCLDNLVIFDIPLPPAP